MKNCTLFININTKILIRLESNTISTNQLGFIQGMQKYFNIRKLVNILLLKGENKYDFINSCLKGMWVFYLPLKRHLIQYSRLIKLLLKYNCRETTEI